MEIYEIKLKVYLKKSMSLAEDLRSISIFLNGIMSQQQEWPDNSANFVFSSFYPIAQKGYYEKDRNYMITRQRIESEVPVFSTLRLLNRAPIKVSYQRSFFWGDKVELTIAADELSQEIAYTSLGTGIGIGERHGWGFVNYQWIKTDL